MSRRVDGKVAVITGGARGQGVAHGELLAREGAKVVLADVLDDEGKAAAARLAGEGLDVSYTHLDVADETDWKAAVAFARDLYGPVTVLVNNAGIGGDGDLTDVTRESWDRTIAVNLTGPLLGIQAVVPGMRASGGGSIINTASDWAHTGGWPHKGASYCAAKAGILGLTRNAALTLAEDGIRVNSISPATVVTPMIGDTDPATGEVRMDDMHQELVARSPMKRGATPIEISYIVLYLASDESSYASGADFLIDGALHTL